MKNRIASKTFLTVAVALAAQFILDVTPAQAQLDETCKVTCNGRTVDVGYGGEFTIGAFRPGRICFGCMRFARRTARRATAGRGLFKSSTCARS